MNFTKLFLNIILLRYMHGHVPGAINIPHNQIFIPDTIAAYKGSKLTVVMGKSSENESQVNLMLIT